MNYVDGDGVDSQTPEQLRKRMGVFLVVRGAFGLTVSEVKTGFMRLRINGIL